MKTKMIVAGLMTAFFLTIAASDAQAHRWRRRGVCAPARVVVVVPPVIVPRVVVPPPVRIVRPVCAPRVYVHNHRRANRYYRNSW